MKLLTAAHVPALFGRASNKTAPIRNGPTLLSLSLQGWALPSRSPCDGCIVGTEVGTNKRRGAHRVIDSREDMLIETMRHATDVQLLTLDDMCSALWSTTHGVAL